MDYIIPVNITDNNVIYIREITLYEYIQLQKICIASDMNTFMLYIDKFISEISNYNDNLNIIDKVIILLSIYKINMSQHKEFNSYKNGNKIIVNIYLDDIINDILYKYNELCNSCNVIKDKCVMCLI